MLPPRPTTTTTASTPVGSANPVFVDLVDKLDVSAPLLTLDSEPTFTAYSALKKQCAQHVTEIRQFDFSGVSLPNPKSSKKSPLPHVLCNAYGHTKPNEILTILGPSALAQTEMLNILAGRHHAVNALLPGAKFTANESVDLFTVIRAGFVNSAPKHVITCTVEEEFDFACKLRMPAARGNITAKQRDEVCKELMQTLHLSAKAKSQVQHLSKSDLKRLAIGVELLSMPNVLFVDQPLVDDRREDWQTMQILQALQRSNICQVVVGVFAPRDEIFQEASQHFVLLGARGQTLCVGGVDQAKHFFAARGYTNPECLSYGDFFLLSAEYDSEEIVKEEEEAAAGSKVTPAPYFQPETTLLVQFVELFKRELLYVKRLPGKLLSRFLSVAIIMGLCAVLFTSAGDQTHPLYNAATHFSSFVFPILSMSFSAALPTTAMLHEYKQVLLREQSQGSYSLAPAIAVKMITGCITNFAVACEAVIILYWSIHWGGSFMLFVAAFFLMMEMVISFGYLFTYLCENVGKAIGLVSFMMGPQLFFLGTFARYAAMPNWLYWLGYVCNMAYTMRILSSIEFESTRCTTPSICAQHLQTLASNYVDPDLMWAYFLICLLFLIVYRIFAFVAYFRVLSRVT